eukprot:scaffold1893_cov120-Isochrysis_galbana.AAC.1
MALRTLRPHTSATREVLVCGPIGRPRLVSEPLHLPLLHLPVLWSMVRTCCSIRSMSASAARMRSLRRARAWSRPEWSSPVRMASSRVASRLLAWPCSCDRSFRSPVGISACASESTASARFETDVSCRSSCAMPSRSVDT